MNYEINILLSNIYSCKILMVNKFDNVTYYEKHKIKFHYIINHVKCKESIAIFINIYRFIRILLKTKNVIIIIIII